ncbi:MAG: c-type cytochrome [Phycisphaeraceae bacterium]
MKLSNIDLDLRLPKPPMVLVAVLVIGAFVPMGIASAIWYKRNAFDPNPRIHIFQDMDNQAKAKAQSASDIFADGRSMRDYAPGTVAWGRSADRPDPSMLKEDDLLFRGFETDPKTGETVFVEDDQGTPQPKYLAGYPQTLTIDRAFIERGRHQYMVHCYTCHGADGFGVGPSKTAMDLLAGQPETGTVPLIVANLHDPKFAEGVYANGRMYNTIAKGQGTMAPGIGRQIDVKDRWAIVAYVRAMQHAQTQAQAENASE